MTTSGTRCGGTPSSRSNGIRVSAATTAPGSTAVAFVFVRSVIPSFARRPSKAAQPASPSTGSDPACGVNTKIPPGTPRAASRSFTSSASSYGPGGHGYGTPKMPITTRPPLKASIAAAPASLAPSS